MQWIRLVGLLSGLWLTDGWAGEMALPDVRRSDAVLQLSGGESYDGRGQTLRCSPGQRVGVWLDGDDPITLRDVQIDRSCLVGVVLAGDTAHVVTKVTASALSACIWFQGSTGGGAYSNTVSQCTYGIVVEGSNIQVVGNHSFNNDLDGILVVGRKNTIKDNLVEQNGRHGIDVVQAVPQLGSGQFVAGLPVRSMSNVISGNTVTGSGVYDLRQWPASSTCGNLGNSWSGNTAPKRIPSCLQ